MNGNNLIEFEEKHPDLQMNFLETKGYVEYDEYPESDIMDLLESDEYWKFVEEEYNARVD